MKQEQSPGGLQRTEREVELAGSERAHARDGILVKLGWESAELPGEGVERRAV